MKLLIVESPAKARTITQYLGKEFTVKASIGHVRDLPKSNRKAVDIEAGFVPHYEIVRGREKIVRELSSLAKKADDVIFATDPDREGEAIAWHLKELTGVKNPKRIVFHEITKGAITDALKHPRGIDENLRKAQEARRVLDRLVGYDLSGLIWKKLRYGLSAGRVQSPALRILVEREREIKAFKPETYFLIIADLETGNPKNRGERLTLTCDERPREKAVAEWIIEAGQKGKWFVVDVLETELRRSPRAPFITSTLQQAGSSRFGFSPARTMTIAQRLYEAGLITYMRTDSVNIGESARMKIHSLIASKYGKEYLEPREYRRKIKNAQEAHEAIRPTDVSRESAGATPAERKIYDLISRRTISSQMTDAKVARTTIKAEVREAEVPSFSTAGSRIVFDGWLKASPNARGEEVELPKVEKGEVLRLIEIRNEEKETQPPPRYSEAGLVKELEKRGIGRPSTYATIMKTLEERGYVTKDGRILKPTDTGEIVSAFLEEHFAPYISDSFTAQMEDKLDDIAQGKLEYIPTLKSFYRPFSAEVRSKEKIAKLTTLGAAGPEHRCPTCKGEMVIKLGRSGRFLSCGRFPECSGARTIDGRELEAPRETGETCPECGGKLVERDGKFGKFIACGNYPKCTYVKRNNTETINNNSGMPCPICRKGILLERHGRFGTFWSCSTYPKCSFTLKGKPAGTSCLSCGAPMMEGVAGKLVSCSNRECQNYVHRKGGKVKRT